MKLREHFEDELGTRIRAMSGKKQVGAWAVVYSFVGIGKGIGWGFWLMALIFKVVAFFFGLNLFSKKK